MGRKKKQTKSLKISLISIILFVIVTGIGYLEMYNQEKNKQEIIKQVEANSIAQNIELDNIPEYDGKPYVEINNNIPDFKEEDYTD